MATTSPDNLWSPDAGDEYDLTVDMAASMQSVQAALEKRANSYRGTSGQRVAFSSQARVGDHWQDTNASQELYVWTGVWTMLPRRNHRVFYQVAGTYTETFPAPATTPTASSDIIIKTGFWHGFTTFTLGNEYAQTINFSTAFPNACGSVTAQQIHVSGMTGNRPWAIDRMTSTGFRVLWPGGSGSTERGFTWTAVGW